MAGTNITDYETGSSTSGEVFAINAGGAAVPGELEVITFTTGVAENTDYELSFAHVIWDPNPSFGGGPVTVYVNGTLIATLTSATTSPPFGTWSFFQQTINTGPSNTMDISIRVQQGTGNAGHDYLFDAVSLAPVTTQILGRDSDNDGIDDHLDLDSDNDGIPDNIEAQATDDYTAPSGTGAGITDANNDGLDDNYDTRTVTSATPDAIIGDGEGLTPVNTDGDADADFIDTDSDNEGGNDTAEAGLTGTATGFSTAANDADGDGLFDVFDAQNGTAANDGFIVNESLNTGAISYPDTDSDASAASATPLTADVDFRDAQDDLDTDEDGVADAQDVDDDNDGILDTVEDQQDHVYFTWDGLSLNTDGATDTSTITLPDGSTVTATVELVGNTPVAGVNIPDNRPAAQFEGTQTPGAEAIRGASGTLGATYGLIVTFDRPIDLLFTDGELTISSEPPFTVTTNGENFSVIDSVNPALVTSTGVGTQTVTMGGNSTTPAALLLNSANTTQIIVNAPKSSAGLTGVTFGLIAPAIDSDGDGLIDSLDLDSDNDGITDNIEAQATDAYIAPSGVGGTPGFIDANSDGLDDNYDTRSTVITTTAAATEAIGEGLAPVDSDTDGDSDYLDTDSDDDGVDDTAEAGLTGAPISGTLSDSTNDADGDGLFDVFDAQDTGSNANDGFVVNARYRLLKKSAATSAEYYNIQRGILQQTKVTVAGGAASEQTLIREEMNTLVAAVEFDVAYADLQNAFAAIYASTGVDPHEANISTDMSVDQLAATLRTTWRNRGDKAG